MTYVQPHHAYKKLPGDPFGELFAELMIMDFSINPSEREPNSFPYEVRVLDPGIEHQLRNQIQDEVEIIIPVTWSLESFLGFQRPDNLDLERAIETAHVFIESHALETAESITTSDDPCFRAPYAYVDMILRCSALNETGYQRHGFLAVCKNGVALIGNHLDWTPSQITSVISGQNAPQASLSQQHRHLYTQMPIGNPGYQSTVLEYIGYKDLPQVLHHELIRFDGFATLLYATQGDYALQNENYRSLIENYLGKPLPPLLHPGAVLPTYFPRNPLGDIDCAELFILALETSDSYYDFFRSCFAHEVSDRLCAGWMPVVGPGMTSDNLIKLSSFGSSLGLELVTSTPDHHIYVESIFSELDDVLRMIKERVETSHQPKLNESPQQRENLNPPSGLVEQLQRLTMLRDSGALTDEEFTSAKAQILGKL